MFSFIFVVRHSTRNYKVNSLRLLFLKFVQYRREPVLLFFENSALFFSKCVVRLVKFAFNDRGTLFAFKINCRTLSSHRKITG